MVRIASTIYKWLLYRLPFSVSLILARVHNRAAGLRNRFSVASGKLLVTSISERPHVVAANPRSLLNLVRGPSERGRRLKTRYLLGTVEGNLKNVIDVGANTGDFLLALEEYEISSYLGIEPIKEDYECLVENLSDRGNRFRAFQVALGPTEQIVEIFVSRGGADSSLIEPAAGYTEKRQISVVSMDSLLGSSITYDEVIDLLKIEAEGYEPEVLEGSRKILKQVRYVSVDGGPERGPGKESTIEMCSDFLVNLGFQIVKIESATKVGLFRNTKNP